MRGCEICKRGDVPLAIVPVACLNRIFIMCHECFVSFMCQKFTWDEQDISDYVGWIGEKYVL